MSIQLRSGLFVGLITLLSWSPLFGQICAPDLQYDSLGLYPAALPQGMVGQAYEAVATAVIPESFEVSGIPLDICKAEVVSTTPALSDYGLAYDCEPTGCVIEINHSDTDTLTYGCLAITGTPTQTLDSVVANFRVFLGSYSAMTNVCSFDPNPSSALPLSFTVNLKITETTNIAALEAQGYRLRAYQGAGALLEVQLTLPQTDRVRISVLDVQGRTVMQQAAQALPGGDHRFSLPTGEWTGGVYLLRVDLDQPGQPLTQKVLLAH
jgi:hypothetical protein